MLDPLAEAAIAYAHQRLPVFPVRGKAPFLEGGYRVGTTDPALVGELWRAHPGSNIGYATGATGWVLDEDPRHGGDLALRDLELHYGPLPDTPEVQTGGGGRHLHFAPDARVGTSRGGLPAGLDVRGFGGLAVLPPSVHPETNKPYVHLLGHELGELPRAVAPAWLLDLIVQPSTRTDTADPDGPIGPGDRHQFLLRRGSLLAYLGATDEAIVAELEVLNKTRCAPPLPEEGTAGWHRLLPTLFRYADRGRARARSDRQARGTIGLTNVDDLTGDDLESTADTEPARTRTWPAPLEPEAFHGLAGELVRSLLPDTEADPVALLLHVLVAYGNAVNRTAVQEIEGDLHYPNLFAVMVGATSKGRKGTAWGRVRRFFGLADPEWTEHRILGGLSSGEGMIWAVRDPISKQEKAPRRAGEPLRYEQVEVDPGVRDKRLLALEPEFASVLRRIEQEGNSLSALMRLAWDTGILSTLTKNAPATATDAHVSIIGHITGHELLRYLPRTELANGFANRFLFACVRRSKLLPRGGLVSDAELLPFSTRLRRALEHARKTPRLIMGDATWDVWDAIYPTLSGEYPGLVGAMLSRAEAQVRRLAGLYALLDGGDVITSVHLLAALAVWQFCAESVCFVFGDAVGDPVTDELLRALRAAGRAGLTRRAMFDLFQRHRSAADIGHSLSVLLERKLAAPVKEPTGGRPVERWMATPISPATSEQSEQRGLCSFSSLCSLVALAREVVARQQAEAAPASAGGVG